MMGLHFTSETPTVGRNPNRVDVACFVGFVERRSTPVSAPIERWLYEQGWIKQVGGVLEYVRSSSEALLDLPIPIDSWETFSDLFRWEARGTGAPQITYLGAAVRSFFAQGGRKCYVVRVGDPWPFGAPRADRMAQMEKLLPGYPGVLTVSPVEREEWRGVGHLFGLPDISFVALPDLPEIVSGEAQRLEQERQVFGVSEQFVESSANEPDVVIEATAARVLAAPMCDEIGYGDWARAVNEIANLLAARLREVQFVGALPIPTPDSLPGRNVLRYLTRDVNAPMSAAPHESRYGIASAFVQLGYPWLFTRSAERLPGGGEPPDGVLVGLLARNAIARGTFRVAALLRPAEVFNLEPVLGQAQIATSIPDSPVSRRSHSLMERISLFGQTASGLVLRSDVTTSRSESYRPASVNRLVQSIIRAARLIGEDAVFEPSSHRVWANVRDQVETLMLELLQAGALRGTNAADAFEVRCDRTTMTQNDMDNGRVVAQVQFDAALPIERITVVLVVQSGGQVALLTSGEAA